MKGNKFLAAALAASMAFSMVPATTLNVFADSVSVEASDTAVASTDQVVVVNTVDGKSTISKKLQAAVAKTNAGLNGVNYYDASSKAPTATAATDIAAAIHNNDSDLTMTISDVTFTDVDHWSFVAYDASGTYTVTIDAAPTLETVNSTLKTALDNYFDTKEFSKAKDKTLRNTDIADVINNDSTGNTDIEDAMDGSSDFTGISYDSGFSFDSASISGDGTAIGSDGSGKLTITITEKNDSTPTTKKTAATFTYNFTATVNESEDTASEANKKALTAVNANTYPDYRDGSTVRNSKGQNVTHNASLLNAKILADLKDAGYTSTTSAALSLGSDSAAEEATADSNGEYKVVVSPNNDVVDVELTYSSDQKLNDTDTSLEKFLAKGSAAGSGATVTEHKDTDGSYVALDDATTVSNSYSYAPTGSLSQKIQAKTATTATTAADAAEIVKASIDEQLKKDGVEDNGVNVTVTPVNIATEGSAGNAGKYDVDAGSKESTTSSDDSKITLLVTASISNDFYGWSNGTNTDDVKTVKQNYLMTINTNPLKENKITNISLADKTVLLSGGYYSASKTSGQTSANEVTYVEITPVIDPADANTGITYKVLDSDKTVVTDDVQVDDGNEVYKAGSDTAVSVGTNALGLKITKAGTYTITATSGNAEATMTLTVKNNFDDVSGTAYYKNAVTWAYGNGVTDGVTGDLFGVNNDVTRAQFVTWLYRYAVSEDSSVAIDDDDVTAAFSDVATDKYYAKAVQWAVANGITDGTSGTTFSPDQKISRAQAITMLWRLNGKPYAGSGSTIEDVTKFTDVPADAYYTTAVTWAVQTTRTVDGQKTAITSGTSTTTFSPNADCTRAQAITFIYRAYA